MAEPTETYPESATHGGRETADGTGEAALRAALEEHGEELAAAVGAELDDVLTTAIVVAASADEGELDHVTESTANLVTAADGLSTEGAAALATDVGESAEDLRAALGTVVDLQRAGHLDDLLTVATAFSGSLSPGDLEELAAMLEADGPEVVAALDLVLDLQREGHLEELLATAETLSALDVEPEAAAGLNALLGAVGEAERDAEPVGILGALSALGDPDAKTGLGYLLAVLRGVGRRLGR
ncbi:MAG: DUF1641 domain-containing protein [Halobacteriales archaeon]